MKRTPTDFLKQVIGRQVVVRLNDGTDYRGILHCLDDRLNLAMESVSNDTAFFNDAFIRGNNVMYIRVQGKDENFK